MKLTWIGHSCFQIEKGYSIIFDPYGDGRVPGLLPVRGFADMVFVPRKTTQTPAIVVELKWNQTAEAAITQIKRKQYVESLKDYRGEVILVGINYESKELKKDDYKKHSCKIERITMA